MKQRFALLVVLIALCAGSAFADDAPQKLEWKIDGVTREAMVYLPAKAKTEPTPIVFVFHGHGGGMTQMVNRFAVYKLWPEAISVYMQGLNTPGKTDPEGKKPGWQKVPGDQGDRDLKFFDAVLKQLRTEYKIDDKRIYSTGHSNGGGFTYLLWAVRGDNFAAMAPSSGGGAGFMKAVKPKPVLICAGEKDDIVPFEGQKAVIDAMLKMNECEATGKPWGDLTTYYKSKTGLPVVTFIHPGGHNMREEIPALAVKFFKEQSRK